MKSMRDKKNRLEPKAASPEEQTGGVKYEWPLLIYPVLFLATLAILHLINRSVETEWSAIPAQKQDGPQDTAARDPSRSSDTTVTLTRGSRVEREREPVSDAEESGRASRTLSYLPPKREGRTTGGRGRSIPTADRTQPAVPDQLQGPDRVIALLQMAVAENDHARIKECVEQLVALGDAAVVPLNDLIYAESEAGLWAAEALARIGTPMATSALLERLAQTKEGLYKEELGKRVSNISNHDSWPILLDSIVQTADATVLRAAGASLSRMADTPVVDAIVAHYDTAGTEEMAERLAQLVRTIESPSATEALLSLAGPVSSPPQDSLAQAAIDALGRIGDAQCVSHLLRRLEAAAPGEGTEVFNTITQISRPEAYTALLYAAAGNKEVSAESGRTAAVYALKNYPGKQTIALLESIIAEVDNDKLRAAATRTLDDIKQAPHTITAQAEPLVKEEPHLLPPPLDKR